MPQDPSSPFRVNRRLLIASGGASLLLAACGAPDNSGSAASATRGGDRFDFPDTVGWLELNGRMAVVAFVPYVMSQRQREAVIKNRGVYPALEPYDPMIELRFELTAPEERLIPDEVKAVQLTFWHFATPAPVIRGEGDAIGSSGRISLTGLDGEPRHGGWAVGTVRGQEIVSTPSGRNVSYTFNLSFQSNFG